MKLEQLPKNLSATAQATEPMFLDVFDEGAAFISETTSSLRRTKPALARVLSRLATDVAADACVTASVKPDSQVAETADMLGAALCDQLDELRLASHPEASAIILSAALAAVALIGAAAHSRRGESAAATAQLDAAWLRARAERHGRLLLRAVAVIESEGAAWHSDRVKKRPRDEEQWELGAAPAPSVFERWPGSNSHQIRSLIPTELSRLPCAPPSSAPATKRATQAAGALVAGGQAGGAAQRQVSEQLSDQVSEQVHAPSEPVLLKGLVRDWPAVERWSSPAYLRRKAGHRLVPIEVGAAHLSLEGEGVCEQQVVAILGVICEQQVVAILGVVCDRWQVVAIVRVVCDRRQVAGGR